MKVYYNEIDKFAVEWLKQLILFGAIPDGDIDTRPIQQIDGWELGGYDQCHFFAGIGGWAHALELAQWKGPVWTGSCPCQPFSVAGQGRGEADERHLWPYFHRLIADCGPPVVFGEQVASALGRGWLARVRADLEALGYGVGAADLCAAGVSAPHIRQRLYWLAESENQQQHGRGHTRRGRGELADYSLDGERVADADGGHAGAEWQQRSREHGQQQAMDSPDRGLSIAVSGECGGLTDTDSGHHHHRTAARRQQGDGEPEPCGATDAWSTGVFVPCLDGKARRVEPGIFPLVDGFPNRVGTLRGAGNAIVPQVAEAFIRAYKEGL